MTGATKAVLSCFVIGAALMAGTMIPQRYVVSQEWYESSGDEVRTLPTRTEMCAATQEKYGESRVTLTFRPRVLRNYQNIFQTSDVNAGIRFEIDESGGLGVVVGTGDGTFIAAGSGVRAEVGKFTIARIRVVSDKGIYLKVDDAPEVHTPGVPRPVCDRFLLGAGFDDTRTFDGEVSSRMSTGKYEFPMPAREQARLMGQFLLFGAFLAWSLRDEKSSENKEGKVRSEN